MFDSGLKRLTTSAEINVLKIYLHGERVHTRITSGQLINFHIRLGKEKNEFELINSCTIPDMHFTLYLNQLTRSLMHIKLQGICLNSICLENLCI